MSISPQRESTGMQHGSNSVTFETLAAQLAEAPFHQLLGLRLEAYDAAAQSVAIRCVFSARLERAAGTGQLHGGVIASLIDIAGDFALIGVVGHGVPTINFRVDYLRPAFGTDLIARARVRRAGKTVGVVDVDVDDGSGRLIATGRGCYGTNPG
jgi:uncharacterized protein (TIGR00369 family)